MGSDYRQSTRKVCEFSLGPLRWRFASVREARDTDADDLSTPEDFMDALKNLIDQALHDGCTPEAVNAVLGQYTHGDRHVDA